MATARITRWNAAGVIASLRSEMTARMETAAGYLEGEIKGSMKGGGQPHVASLPGETPRIDLGDLLRSIGHSVTVEGGVIRGYVTADSDHALPLELGTDTIAPRPFMRPALARGKKRIKQILAGR